MKRVQQLLIASLIFFLTLPGCKPLESGQAVIQSTDTQQFILSSPTSLLPTEAPPATETSAPKESPTEMPVPTFTLPPKQLPTPVSLDTPPGSLLQVGQYWRQSDVSLVLESIDFYPDQSCATFEFDLDNNSSQELILTILASQFAVTDNTGGVWTVRMLSHSSLCGTSQISADSQIAVSIEPGGSFWDSGYTTWLLSFDGPLTNPAVTELTITVNGLSHFTDAKWVIPIAR